MGIVNQARGVRIVPLLDLSGLLMCRSKSCALADYQPGSQAWHNVHAFVALAELAGHAPPEPFAFLAGQLMIRDQQVEEVRLSGYVGEPGAQTRWSTPVAPKLILGAAGSLTVDPADADRPHFSAAAFTDESGRQWVAFEWNLQLPLALPCPA